MKYKTFLIGVKLYEYICVCKLYKLHNLEEFFDFNLKV